MKIHVIDLEFQGHKNGIAAFLIESSDGPILVETGPHSSLKTLEQAVNKLDYKLSDIKHVFITHIHLDHAGAAWCFADLGAKVYLHPVGYKHMHDPSRLLASAKMIYKDNMDRLWGTLKPISQDLLITVDHLSSVEVGGLRFVAHHTPGHAKHHIAWQVDDVIFTGDVAGVSINDGPVIPPCPPPDIDREAWMTSIDHLLSVDDITTYYLTHFGKVTNVGCADEVLPEFRIFVQQYLISEGLSQDDAAAYEAANPSDMSATGLMRYWAKRASI